MSALRGLRRPVLVLAAAFVGWIWLAAPAAHAQVFKPRGRAPKTAATAKAPAATTAAARKAAPAPAATTSQKPTRAIGPTPRKVNAAPAKKQRRGGKGRSDRNDDVRIEDDDDDVKITDD